MALNLDRIVQEGTAFTRRLANKITRNSFNLLIIFVVGNIANLFLGNRANAASVPTDSINGSAAGLAAGMTLLERTNTERLKEAAAIATFIVLANEWFPTHRNAMQNPNSTPLTWFFLSSFTPALAVTSLDYAQNQWQQNFNLQGDASTRQQTRYGF
jgi:hypothetical protein